MGKNSFLRLFRLLVEIIFCGFMTDFLLLLAGGCPQVLERLSTVLQYLYHYVCLESLEIGHLRVCLLHII